MSITTIVTTTAQLLATLAGAQPGDVIKLAPGTYSNVAINKKIVPQTQATPGAPTRVLITSEFSNNQAVLTDLNINSSTGLYFGNLAFSAASTPVGPGGSDTTVPFQVYRSSQMTFIGISVVGNPSATYNTDVSGLFIENSTHVAVQNSSFQYLHNAIDQVGNNYLTISGSSFSNLADDGIRGGGTSNVTINNNTFTSQHLDAADPDHPDAIQFWTSNTAAGTSNITIADNVISRGDGNPVQGIFLNDEMGNRSYTNVYIHDNTISGESYNGIVVDDGISTHITSNTVNSYPDFTSGIWVLNSRTTMVNDNQAGSYRYLSDTNLVQVSNTVIAPIPNPTDSGPALSFSTDLAGLDTEGSVMSAVPEPSVWSMMLLGVASCGGLLRSRGRRARRVAA